VTSQRSEELNDRLADDLRHQRPDALERLLAEFGQRIQAVAYLVLGSQADAEEVVMDTMVTAWRKGRDLRSGAALGTWLLRIAMRLALTRRRRIGTAVALSADEERLIGSSTPSIDRLALLDALDSLPTRMRAAIVLHYYADLTVDRVAAVLERSPNTVKSQLREGLTRLRAALDDGELARRRDR
jgi:RNA polymerase sigma-70 factor (ECF subfamily)